MSTEFQYPLDTLSTKEFFDHILAHEQAQASTIQAMESLLNEVLQSVDFEDGDNESLQRKISLMVKGMAQLKIDHENRRFNENNLRVARGMQPKSSQKIAPPTLKIQLKPIGEKEMVDIENSIGEEMSEAELSRFFSTEKPAKKPKKEEEKPFSKMTLEEIKEWEAKHDNSNDIYKVAARVKNLAREGGKSLTAHGEMLANSYVHVLVSLYKFADKLGNAEERIKLTELIRSQEGMPAQVISAAGVGKKSED
jgi:hypothetical protein